MSAVPSHGDIARAAAKTLSLHHGVTRPAFARVARPPSRQPIRRISGSWRQAVGSDDPRNVC